MCLLRAAYISSFLHSFRKEHWTNGLVKQGVYFEGWVSDLDSVLASHSRATVTCYGIRRSTKNFSEDKENCPTEVCSISIYYDEGSVGIVFFSGYPKIVLEQGHCNAFRQHTILCVGEQALRMPLWPTLLQRQASKKSQGTATRQQEGWMQCTYHDLKMCYLP